MTKLVVVGGGITGLMIGLLYSGDSIILEKEKKIANNSRASLWSIMPPLCGSHKQECEKAITFYSEICEKYGIYCKKTHILRLAQNKIGGKILDRKEIKGLEPILNIDEAEYFNNAFFIEGEELFNLVSTDLHLEMGCEVLDAKVENNEIKYLITNKGNVKGEHYIFTTGYLSSKILHKLGIDMEILTYKGHLIISNKKIGLNGILIVNDRIAVEGKNLYLNGDSKLDSSIDINYEEIYRTINEIGKIIRVDTSALEIRVGFRSVSKDGEPIVRNIFSNALLVTGYRFGFALAPILARKAIDLIKS